MSESTRKNAVPRAHGITTDILRQIGTTAIKEEYENGYYKRATFMVNGKWYHLDEYNTLQRYVEATGKWLYCSENRCKNGSYSQWSISRMGIKTYIVTMLCKTDGFYEKYMSDKAMVVNHCVVSKKCFNGVWMSVPYFYTEKDPRYLEVIPHWRNTKHYDLIERYGLWDTYVSGNDVEELEKLFSESKSKDYRGIVAEYYSKKKPNFKVLF